MTTRHEQIAFISLTSNTPLSSGGKSLPQKASHGSQLTKNKKEKKILAKHKLGMPNGNRSPCFLILQGAMI